MSQIDVLQALRETLEEVESRSFVHIIEQTLVLDLEVDSVTMMEVIGCLEDDLNIQIPDEKLSGLNTVGDIVSVIRERLE